ncbi:tRNA threonylcarbamoyladenosine dehydratase [Anaerosphaera multitolerans]|uniref:tRNA threonylcarbamoyladenosine dehydratase n=1 Tax=Anaerosphaera multitolerans TaxID=2487351 RepID=A0A437S6Z0_9FIRM|nr:tRNA threonylcarbamoyladenosine dehydratase [Anaerosphaera multitolerans]RVU54799.1 tRNA threonylcarbamoyladenosine dehydratase [Anaerosphaera multitolerans]
MEIFNRLKMLIGEENLKKLQSSKVLVIGLGGVGGSLCEALVRGGIGEIDIVDGDEVDETNLNRQIIATVNSVGMRKVDAMEERLKSINPMVKINKYDLILSDETMDVFNFEKYDYICDAIDSVKAKISLAERAYFNGYNLISAMGTGNKLDPTKLEVTDINKTSVCPLARVMRRELKDRGVKKLKVVYSREIPHKPLFDFEGKIVPGSISFVPPVCGMIMASEIINSLIEI